MIKKIEYTDEMSRETILSENQSLFLIEEQNLLNGNFLIFTDVRPFSDQLADQETRIADVELALADLFTGGV